MMLDPLMVIPSVPALAPFALVGGELSALVGGRRPLYKARTREEGRRQEEDPCRTRF